MVWSVALAHDLPTPRASNVRIEIKRWSTDAERQQLLTAAKSGRPEAVSAMLERVKLSAGTFSPAIALTPGDESDYRTAAQIGYGVDHREPNGTRRIVLLSYHSPIVLWIEFVVQESGIGEGAIRKGGRIVANKEGTDIELKPSGDIVALTDIRPAKRK